MEILHGKERIKKCTHDAKKTRRNGFVPGILYGDKIQSVLFEFSEMELSREINSIGEHGVIDVDIDGNHHKALIKEIQREPVNHKIIHIDLEHINPNKTIQSEVPIIFEAEDEVVRNGGVLQKEKGSIKVQCKAESLPKYININLKNCRIGNVYRISDIEAGSEITFIEDVNSVIATISGGNTNVKIDDETSSEATMPQGKANEK